MINTTPKKDRNKQFHCNTCHSQKAAVKINFLPPSVLLVPFRCGQSQVACVPVSEECAEGQGKDTGVYRQVKPAVCGKSNPKMIRFLGE